jgi:putative membrane protein
MRNRLATAWQAVPRGTLAAVVDVDDLTVGEGDDREPDYRFTLANERTFLAWVRTSLALLAGGVAIRFIARDEDVEAGRVALAVGAIALAALVVVSAYRRWAEVQEAMRHGRPLPRAVGIIVLAVGVAALAVASAIVVLL